MVKRIGLLAAILIFLLLWGAVGIYAQDVPQPSPTPESEATAEITPVVETPPDVSVVIAVPAPVELPADTNTPAFLLAGVVFAAIAAAAFVSRQHGIDLKEASKTIPPEFAQFIFRQGMTQALTTELTWDDEAVKEAARQLGYDVIEDGRGGYSIVATASVVAENKAIAKEVTG